MWDNVRVWIKRTSPHALELNEYNEIILKLIGEFAPKLIPTYSDKQTYRIDKRDSDIECGMSLKVNLKVGRV